MSALRQALAGLSLVDPWMLALALLVPAALWLRRRGGAPAVAFAPSPLLRSGPLAATRSLPRSWRARLAWLPRALEVLGLLLAVLALARPQQRVQLPLEVEGIDILLCIDVSSSMAARDLDPERTRLDLAREAAASFIAGRPHDRIGLIRFARYPDVICPLTLDHRALATFLDELDLVEPDGLEDLTGVGTAVARAAQVLQKSLADSKVAILLTDGEENVATARTPDEIGPLLAARMCQEIGVRAYTIAAGIGKRTAAGEWIPLDTRQVERLAELTGGEFYEARDADALTAVYATIDQLEKARFEEPRYERRDAFLPLLIAAASLMLLARALRSTVLGALP